MSNAIGSIPDDIDVEGMRDYLARTDVDFVLLFGSAARGQRANRPMSTLPFDSRSRWTITSGFDVLTSSHD